MNRNLSGWMRKGAGLGAAGLMLSGGQAVAAASLDGPPAHTGVRDILKLSILGNGGGFQLVAWNYSRQTTGVSPYKTGSSGLPFLLPAGEQVGLFLYDYWQGGFTQAVYAGR